MRHLGTGLLVAALVLPVAAYSSQPSQSPKFVKIEITSTSGFHSKHGGKVFGADAPDNVEIRLPITLAKAILENIDENEIKINGKDKKGMKVDQLINLLQYSNIGDLLLEVKTNKGDLVKITLE